MNFLAVKPQSCDNIAETALAQSERALHGLIDALAKSEAVIYQIDDQIDSLMARKAMIMKRNERIESVIDAMSDALHPVDPNELVTNA
tara:strand:- start:826 stop:1089 length:264 start_codon:yes stop_codon:yes gene_type:complete